MEGFELVEPGELVAVDFCRAARSMLLPESKVAQLWYGMFVELLEDEIEEGESMSKVG